ncbi:hypothetical protein BofuT4_uP126210.1 [Botrytis cinerea T4]|uniref:Uncharacterized protein n=1 Tax=Botryotinia fuckeliana (strain T4) TaxID=999810 RepID=G2YSH5_BOTF4|nr:hypothetical protein BofuT4_uP126210.1 [Botrytis cinerea T4]
MPSPCLSLPLPASPCLSLPLHPRATSQLEAMLRPTFKSSHIHPGVCAIDPKLARWKIAIVSAHSSCPAIQIHT